LINEITQIDKGAADSMRAPLPHLWNSDSSLTKFLLRRRTRDLTAKIDRKVDPEVDPAVDPAVDPFPAL